MTYDYEKKLLILDPWELLELIRKGYVDGRGYPGDEIKRIEISNY